MQIKFQSYLILAFSMLLAGQVFAQCPGPDSIIVSRLQADNATFIWDMGAPTDYSIEIGEAGFVQGTGTRIITTDTVATFSGMTEKTKYDVHLYSLCANGDRDTISLEIESLYKDDIGITFLDAPMTGCDLTFAEDITISITNFGQNPHSLFDFGYSLEDVEGSISRPFDGVYTGIVGFDSTVMTTFDVKADVGLPGEYKFKIWTDLSNDQDKMNDTFEILITHQPVIRNFPYEWDFEIWKGGWLVDESNSINSSMAFGRPNSPLIPSAASGKAAWTTNLIGNYNANETTVLISPCFDFSGMSNDPYMSFALNFEGESCCDFATAEISINAGRNWTKIGDGDNGINWYNNNEENRWDGEGIGNGWSRVQNRLFGAAGRDSVRIRYLFQSDGSTQSAGIGIDDIHIYEPYAIDAAVAIVGHTSNIECGEVNDSVIVAIENTGLNDITSFIINYSLNNQSAVSQTISTTIAPADRDTFILAVPINTTMDGLYNLRAWVAAPGDAYPENDTLFTDFSIQGVKPLPLVEDFEGSDFPIGWTSNNINIGIDHGAPSSVYYANLNATNPSFSLATPNVGSISLMDTLKFDYRIVNTNGTATTLSAGDNLEVQVSEDCGLTYTSVLTIDQSNHSASTNLSMIRVDLMAYMGKDIKVRFVGSHSSGDYFIDIDNINILSCPASLSLSAVQQASSTGTAADGSITINAAQGTALYTYAWGGGESTQTVTNLAAGSYSVTVTDANNCADMISVDLGSCGSLSTTVNITNESPSGNDGTAMVVPSAGTAPYTYLWETGVTTDMIWDLSMGNYSVTVTDANGCSAVAEAVIDLETSNNSIPDLERFALFPNPSNHELNIDFELSESKPATLAIFNITGQLVYQKESTNNIRHEFDVQTSLWINGIYFIRLSVDNSAISKRLIVQH